MYWENSWNTVPPEFWQIHNFGKCWQLRSLPGLLGTIQNWKQIWHKSTNSMCCSSYKYSVIGLSSRNIQDTRHTLTSIPYRWYPRFDNNMSGNFSRSFVCAYHQLSFFLLVFFSKKNNFACFAFHLRSLCQSNIIKKFSSNSNVLLSKTEEKMTK